ncbi:hypothetical protein GCM10029976_049300 [Kribbella albertanoniae]|uniref:Uncharacterized protein n=1 Tax=Kribbella albertanoniae TaxID=1266829 RepID=A0A4R4PRN6_9ACTN|nr:hypothetical protein [Kribbella albertanoniae]TDC24936.1 hypothetical protein E1261_25160 [Kribbella albertanoniae]
MRSVLKVVGILLAVIGLTAMAVGSFTAAFYGFVEQYAAHYDYVVGFKKPGDSCGNNNLSVSRVTGEPLGCGILGKPGKLPGFTDEQNAEVIALSKELGADGFQPGEREQVQQRVDQIVASLPPERVPQHPWFWGWKVAVAGVLGLLVVAGVVLVVVRRS